MDQAERLRSLVRGRAEPTGSGGCRTIAITSGKGGVGKTTVAVNLAVLLARSGKRAAVVDADLGLSNVDVALGLLPDYHLGHVLDGGMPLEDVCVSGPYGLRVVSGGSGVERLSDLTDAERAHLRDSLTVFASGLDYLIIDTSPGIGRNVMDFLAAADAIAVVTTPEPTSLTDCYAAVKTIYQNDPNAVVSLLVNRAAGEKTAAQVARSIDTVTSRFLGKRVGAWGFLPEDPAAGYAIHKQIALVEAYSGSPAAVALRKMALKLLGTPAALDRRGAACTL